MTSRIQQLADEVAKNTSIIDGFLHEKQLPGPSFEADGPVNALGEAPAEIQAARDRAIEASVELQHLLSGNFNLLTPVWAAGNPSSLHAIFHFKVAEKFSVGEEISYQELAAKCGLFEHDLRRLVRFAIVYHRVFKEPRKGFITHTAASALLARGAVNNYMALVYEESTPAHVHVVDALEKFRGSQKPSSSGYALANNTDLAMYDFLQSHPERAKRFSSAMSTITEASGRQLRALYDWASIPEGSTVVDVGGARGHISAHLAEHFPHLNFVVQDLPEVVDDAKLGDKDTAYQIPDSVKDRVKLAAHSFFDEQPIKGAKVYLLRFTLHNWSDEYAAKILGNLVQAMDSNSRIVIHDYMLPEPGEIPYLQEREVRAMDLIMLTLQNAREREKQDWIDLFALTSKDLQLISAERGASESGSAVIVAGLERA